MEVNAKVGDTVYIRLDRNAARCIRTDEELIQEWKHPGRWVEKSEMVPDYLLYFSKQEMNYHV